MVNVQPLSDGDPRRLGDYDVTGRLGEGGQGIVYLGRGPGGSVAIKLLHAQLIEDEPARARFVREVEVTKRVARFCTAQVLSAGTAQGRPYIISEYVPGPSLHRQLRDEGPRRGSALDRLAINTATALAAIHQAGVVHRDFKPGNVLMGPDGPVVIDFGIARALDATGAMAGAVSQVVGTPAFMAPEQLSEGRIGPHTDMFAWAVTMVFAASGVPAFGHRSIPQVINRILHEEPDLGSLDGRLRPVVAACLNKDPSRRPTARSLMDELMGHHGPAASFAAPSPSAPAAPAPGAPSAWSGTAAAAGPAGSAGASSAGNVSSSAQGAAPSGMPGSEIADAVPLGSGSPSGQPDSSGTAAGSRTDGPRHALPGNTAAAAPFTSGPPSSQAGSGSAPDGSPTDGAARGGGPYAVGNSAGPAAHPDAGHPSASEVRTGGGVAGTSGPADVTAHVPASAPAGEWDPADSPGAANAYPPAGGSPVGSGDGAGRSGASGSGTREVATMRLPMDDSASFGGRPGAPVPDEASSRGMAAAVPSGGYPGGPAHGPDAGPVRRKGRTALIVAAVAAVLVALIAGIGALAGSKDGGKGGQAAAPPPSPKPVHHPAKRHAPPVSRPASHRPPAAIPKANPYTPQRLCGGGYRVVDRHGLGEARVYLLYNSRAGANCVVTMVPRSTGKVPLGTSLVVKGGGRATRSGAYPFYAGPIRLPARGKCVMWGGTSKTASWTSGWSHCGK